MGAVGLWVWIVGWTGSSAGVAAVVAKLMRTHHGGHLGMKASAGVHQIG